MIKKLILINSLIILFSYPQISFSTEFDELDKPPEGAHQGQIFISGIITIGWPTGDYIDAENKFLKGSTYKFENDISKAIEVSHQIFTIGLSFEYMPIDHLGAAVQFRRTYLIQRTNFGPEYENWKGYLYRDISIYAGPSLHATARKQWDFVFTPLLGYSISKYSASPVAKKIIPEYYGETQRRSKGLSYGASLSCSIYFTGGLCISLGGEWLRTSINLNDSFDLKNPQNKADYAAPKSSNITSYNIFISSGYAISN